MRCGGGGWGGIKEYVCKEGEGDVLGKKGCVCACVCRVCMRVVWIGEYL